MKFISLYQLFCLSLLFEIGTGILFSLGIESKQDAWISILISMCIGLFLLSIYIKIQEDYPYKNFIQIIIKVLGKHIGFIISFLYSVYFIYISTRNLIDLSYMLNISLYSDIHPNIISIILLIPIFYILSKGLSTICKLSEISIPIFIFSILCIYIFVSISGKIDINYLKPSLENGLSPIIKSVFPAGILFPFGEMIVFLMYWSYLKSDYYIWPVSFSAVVLSGLMLTISVVIIISTLGVQTASSSTIPLYYVVKSIVIKDILIHLEPFVIIIMFIGGFFKVIIFYYAGITSISTLFNINTSSLIIPIGFLILITAAIIAPNYPFHMWLGLKITPLYIHIPFQVIIPIIIFIISKLKKHLA